MAKVLLSWYDKEDFKSAILKKNRKSNILSALDSKNYSHVNVLCYVDINKVETEDTFLTELKTFTNEKFIDNFDEEALDNFVNKYIYTDRALEYFKREFGNLSKDIKKNIDVRFKKVELNSINDTERVYDICKEVITDSKKIIEHDFNQMNRIQPKGKKGKQNNQKTANKKGYISILLSNYLPSTTIGWSFAVLSNNNVEINLLTPGIIDLVAKPVALPMEYASHVQTNSTSSTKELFPTRYDIMCYLYNEDRISFYLTYKQFEIGKHIVFYTNEDPKAYLEKITKGSVYTEKIPSNSPSAIRESIIKKIAPFENEGKIIGFNVTEGSIINSSGILFAARQHNAYTFFYDYDENKVINIENSYSIQSYTIDNVDEFILLNVDNINIKNHGNGDNVKLIKNPVRQELTEIIYKYYDEYQPFYKQFPDKNNTNIMSIYKRTFTSNSGNIDVFLSSVDNCEIRFAQRKFKLGSFENSIDYLKGKWFEEYVYLKLLGLQEKGLIKDIRINYEVGNNDSNSDLSYQEFDILFTDGKRIYIIECKSGDVKSDTLYKLEKLTSQYGGSAARGVLISCKKIYDDTLKKRVKDAKNIHFMYSDNFVIEMENLIRYGYVVTEI